jgi:putative ABC transport system ATP-binding protein
MSRNDAATERGGRALAPGAESTAERLSRGADSSMRGAESTAERLSRGADSSAGRGRRALARGANSSVRGADSSVPGADCVVRLTDIVKTYKTGSVSVPALSGVSFGISRKSLSMIVGPSGSGKTTLLNIVGCLDTPSSGKVEVNGEDVATLNDNALSDFRARNVGFIFQNFNLIPVLSAFENVEYPLLMLGQPAGERRRAALEILDAVGLAGERDRRPNELSGGQKQRVAIARALVKKPQFVLADEPTANLDSHNGAAIVALMRNMQVQLQTTFIISTHDPQLMNHAEETFMIRDGKLVNHVSGDARS